MQKLTHLRELNVSTATHEDRDLHLSAASGLVRVGHRFYVVADDENHLGVFSALDHAAPGELLRVLPGDLPEGKKKRKAAKADFEALVVLPTFTDFEHGALLALGSGSRENRMNAALIALDEDGAPREYESSPRLVDCSPLFYALQKEFVEVNIEGAFIDGDHVSFLQRGNKGNARNARVRVALAPLLARLARGEFSMAPGFVDIVDFSLGHVNDVPLGFTDAAALPNDANREKGGFVFTAVAEDTENSYADGACAGSVIGFVDANNRVRAMLPLAGSPKVEGVAAQVSGASLTLHLVTDPDDARVAARLMTTTLAME
jgi:hypothetical protein